MQLPAAFLTKEFGILGNCRLLIRKNVCLSVAACILGSKDGHEHKMEDLFIITAMASITAIITAHLSYRSSGAQPLSLPWQVCPLLGLLLCMS